MTVFVIVLIALDVIAVKIVASNDSKNSGIAGGGFIAIATTTTTTVFDFSHLALIFRVWSENVFQFYSFLVL